MAKAYLHRKKELGLLEETEFFDRVAEASGYIDPETAKRVYNGMLTVIYNELRSHGAIRLPALADLQLLLSRPKVIRNRHMEAAVFKPAFHQLRIRPVEAVRNYFNGYQARNPGKILDPAKKLED